MDSETIALNKLRLEANQRYSAKLSWKRKETLELRRQIKEFIEVNYSVDFPKFYYTYQKLVQTNKMFSEIDQEYSELIRTYYTLGKYGESVGSVFYQSDSTAVFTNAHLFSKHRLDPVWNYKKSKLIRSKYYNYLKETNLYARYTPAHITLTLPHKEGMYKGKKFYAKELINSFNAIRKTKWWKKFVYAGEYGIEVTGNFEHGLHIHIHSLAFLKVKDLKLFRETLSEKWEAMTGASQIWVESLYVYKKDEKGKYISKGRFSKKMVPVQYSDGTKDMIPEGWIVEKKKFYIEDEAKLIRTSDVTDQEKQQKILELYTKAILETIKYHFKNDSLMCDSKNYNIFLINEILTNTKKKRLYSRFGAFYKEEALNFNNIKDDDETTDDELNSANFDTVINPFTYEETTIDQTQLAVFFPEKLIYSGQNDIKPWNINYVSSGTFEKIQGKNVRKVIAGLLKEKFKPNKKREKLKIELEMLPEPVTRQKIPKQTNLFSNN